MRLALELSPEQMADLARELAPLVAAELQGEGGTASPWLSLADAADYLCVSPRTLERELKRGLRSSEIGRRRLFHRDDLDALAHRNGRRRETPVTQPRPRRVE